MEVVQVLCMVGGLGRTSYASNSLLQKKAIAKAKPLVEQTLADLYNSILPTSMAVADLGCSSGPNALVVAGEILDVIGGTSRRLGRVPPEIQYFLNDLPGNDFNTLFRYVTSFQDKLRGEGQGRSTAAPPYVSGVAGSFYHRLFPNNSIHFVHSSYCLHFLSQVPRGVKSEAGKPLNKQNIYLSQTSPLVVFQSYLEQFKRDFTSFLKLRSEEVMLGPAPSSPISPTQGFHIAATSANHTNPASKVSPRGELSADRMLNFGGPPANGLEYGVNFPPLPEKKKIDPLKGIKQAIRIMDSAPSIKLDPQRVSVISELSRSENNLLPMVCFEDQSELNLVVDLSDCHSVDGDTRVTRARSKGFRIPKKR